MVLGARDGANQDVKKVDEGWKEGHSVKGCMGRRVNMGRTVTVLYEDTGWRL